MIRFSAAKKFDIEAWIPSQNTYREVTLVQNNGFSGQKVKYSTKVEKDTALLHTLNGLHCSGKNIDSSTENNQTKKGGVEFSDSLGNILGVEN
ncbi:MAG: hypothetical protein Ct9H90mP10_01520 [Actinomycetota bacterium]|nr:MAG: hypothetical protein Ct9H90mP10_01520 [Actinomycetota bacterium]